MNPALTKDQWKSILKGAIIAMVGAALTYLAQEANGQQLGDYAPAAAAGFAVLANYLHKAFGVDMQLPPNNGNTPCGPGTLAFATLCCVCGSAAAIGAEPALRGPNANEVWLQSGVDSKIVPDSVDVARKFRFFRGRGKRPRPAGPRAPQPPVRPSADRDVSTASIEEAGVADAATVRDAAQRFGAKVTESSPQPYLCRAAQLHSEYQATHNTQGHQHFSTRVGYYRQDFGALAYAEICAESWEWQRDQSTAELWTEMFKCWRQSPGHWSVAVAKHKYFGFGMAKGSNGIWYATILVAD